MAHTSPGVGEIPFRLDQILPGGTQVVPVGRNEGVDRNDLFSDVR